MVGPHLPELDAPAVVPLLRGVRLAPRSPSHPCSPASARASLPAASCLAPSLCRHDWPGRASAHRRRIAGSHARCPPPTQPAPRLIQLHAPGLDRPAAHRRRCPSTPSRPRPRPRLDLLLLLPHHDALGSSLQLAQLRAAAGQPARRRQVPGRQGLGVCLPARARLPGGQRRRVRRRLGRVRRLFLFSLIILYTHSMLILGFCATGWTPMRTSSEPPLLSRLSSLPPPYRPLSLLS